MRVKEVIRPPAPIKGLVIELSFAEATVLRNLLGGHVCGGTHTVRAITNDIYDQLCKAGCPRIPHMFSEGAISGQMGIELLKEKLDEHFNKKEAT